MNPAPRQGEQIKTDDDNGRVVLSKKRWVRASAAVFAAALGIVVLWYPGNRIISPRNAVRVIRSNVDHLDGLGQNLSTLRIGTFNIAHGRGTASSNWQGGDEAERLARLREIAQLIKDRRLDVLVLNEVDFSAWWSGHFNQAEFIASAAGFPYRVEQRNIDAATPLFCFRFGNAVLSKYPIIEASLIEFPAYSKLESVLAGKKNGVLCKIQVGEEQTIGVAAIHLDDRSESIRIESVKRIMRRCEACDYPIFWAGDFNSSPKGFPHVELDTSGNSALSIIIEEKKWKTLPGNVPGKDEFTYPTSDPSVVIDWVLVPLDWSIISKEIPLVNLSDHLPVFVQAKLNQDP